MRTGINLAKATDSHPNSPPLDLTLTASPCHNENSNNQSQFDYKTFQVINTNRFEAKTIPQQSPQKYNNMMPGKKLKAIRVNSDKMASNQSTMQDWRSYVNKSQQSQIKQPQNSNNATIYSVVQPSNYNIVSLAQAIQSGSSQNVDTKSQEAFKFTTNNFNKKKRSNTHTLQDVNPNDKSLFSQSNGGIVVVNSNADQLKSSRKSSDHSTACIIYRGENDKDMFLTSANEVDQKIYSSQKSEYLPVRQNSMQESNQRQDSPSLAVLIKQNQQRQFQNLKNTYDFKNSDLHDSNRIKITSIINNKSGNKQNDSITYGNQHQKGEPQISQFSQPTFGNQQQQPNQIKSNLSFLTQLQNPLSQSVVQNALILQPIQQAEQQQQQQQEQADDNTNIFLSKNKNTLYECIFNRQSPQKIAGYKKMDSNIQSRVQTAELLQLTQETTADNDNNQQDSDQTLGQKEEQLPGVTASKKRSSSLQKSPKNNEAYQTNYQFQNLIQIQNQKFLPLQKQPGSQFLYQRMMLKSAQNNIIQKEINSPEVHQNYENNNLFRKGVGEDYKVVIDYNRDKKKQEISLQPAQKRQFRKIVENSSINEPNDIAVNITNNELENIKSAEQQKVNNKVKLDPIQRQERAKSAQDTQFKSFNEETYIVNFDEQKQQILHVRKIRRKPTGDTHPLTSQLQQQQQGNSEDYYNTPIQKDQLKKKNSISQSDIDQQSLNQLINTKQMNIFLSTQTKKQNTFYNINNNNNNLNTSINNDSDETKGMSQTQMVINNKQTKYKVQDIDSKVKFQKNQVSDKNNVDSQESTASATGGRQSLKRDNNGSNKLIKLQQYYDLKYESKYGKFWDNNKRKASSEQYQNKIKHNQKLNMSMQDGSLLNNQTTHYPFNISQSQTQSVGISREQQVDDSKSVLKVLFEKQKREQENKNIFTNPDPWEQESLSDHSFTFDNTEKSKK